jgi:hypothetical protein
MPVKNGIGRTDTRYCSAAATGFHRDRSQQRNAACQLHEPMALFPTTPRSGARGLRSSRLSGCCGEIGIKQSLEVAQDCDSLIAKVPQRFPTRSFMS